jgi:hypothetical protein
MLMNRIRKPPQGIHPLAAQHSKAIAQWVRFSGRDPLPSNVVFKRPTPPEVKVSHTQEQVEKLMLSSLSTLLPTPDDLMAKSQKSDSKPLNLLNSKPLTLSDVIESLMGDVPQVKFSIQTSKRKQVSYRMTFGAATFLFLALALVTKVPFFLLLVGGFGSLTLMTAFTEGKMPFGIPFTRVTQEFRVNNPALCSPDAHISDTDLSEWGVSQREFLLALEKKVEEVRLSQLVNQELLSSFQQRAANLAALEQELKSKQAGSRMQV